MEIKIQCDCGQRYKLDVESVNGAMPFTVNCPICAVDGTQKGTALIQQALAQPPALAAPVAPPAIAPLAGKLKLNMAPAHAPAPAVVQTGEPEPLREPQPTAPDKIGPMAKEAPVITGRKPSFGLGLLGGLVGALVGAILYYIIVKTTGLRISYFAIGVGGLAGWLAELFGKGEGSKELAGITAAFTVGFIILAQYFIYWGVWQAELGPGFDQPAYDREVKHAQLAVQMVPTGSDTEIRNFLAAEQADADTKPDPTSISSDEIKEFHDVQLPAFHDLASGKVTRDQYNTQNSIDPEKDKKRADDAAGTFKAFFIIKLIRWGNLVSLAAAAGLAFRLSANA